MPLNLQQYALWLLLLGSGAWYQTASAAVVGGSSSHFTAFPDRVEGEISIHWRDLSAYFALDENGNGILEASELAPWREGLRALCETFFTLWIGTSEYQFDCNALELDPTSNRLTFHAVWPIPETALPLESFDIAFVAMGDMVSAHRHDLTVADSSGQILFQETFSQASRRSASPNAPLAPLPLAASTFQLAPPTTQPFSLWPGLLVAFVVVPGGIWVFQRVKAEGWWD